MAEIELAGRKVDGEEGRYYTWRESDGTVNRYPSVTTILRDGFPKPGLSRWQANIIVDSVIKKRDTLFEETDKNIEKYLKGLADASKDAAGEKGSIVHDYADAYAHGKVLPDYNEEQRVHIEQFEHFCYDWKPTFLHTEVPVYSRTYGYAGTADGFVQIGDKIYVIDYKTGNRIWPEVALQLAAYRYGDFLDLGGVEGPMPRVSGAFVLHIRPDQSDSGDKWAPAGYELREVKADKNAFNAFLAAMDVFSFIKEDAPYVVQAKKEAPK